MINLDRTVRSLPDGASEVTDVQLPKNSAVADALKHLNKITGDFNSLINDEDGQSLFEEYAKSNEISEYLFFWFAIEGFKKRFNELDSKRKHNELDNKRKHNEAFFQSEVTLMAKAIYNNFIRKNAQYQVYQWFSNSSREVIYNRIKENKLDSNIFREVKTEFEVKIHEEIFPKFLKSDAFHKFSDNLKKNFQSRTAGTRLPIHIKNPYHASPIINFHPTSTQESECQYELRANEEAKEKRNLVNLNRNKLSNGNHSQQQQHAPVYLITFSKPIAKSRHKQQPHQSSNLDHTIYDRTMADRTLQVLYSAGARSHLPERPEDDMEKVKSFFAKLEKICQGLHEVCDQRILSVIEKFEQDGKPNSSLRRFIKKEPIRTEDSQSILEQHCSRVFSSNYNTKGLNSPGEQALNSPKKPLEASSQHENRPNGGVSSKASKQSSLKRHQLMPVGCLNGGLLNGGSSRPQTRPANSTIIMYQYSDEIPYSIRLDPSAIALNLGRFKKEIIKKQIDYSRVKFRYFFKVKDPIENMYIMQELTDDNECVPFCDGRVFAKIEIVPI